MTDRHRTTGALTEPVAVPKQSLYVNCSQSNWTQDASVYASATGTVISMDDVVIPNFHKRRQKGEVFFNPMYRFEGTYACSGGGAAVRANTSFDCSGTARYHEARWVGPYVGYVARQRSGSSSLPPELFALNDEDITDARTEVSTKVLADRGRPTGNLWESIAEGDQAFSMIASLVARANNLFRKNRSFQPTGLSSTTLKKNVVKGTNQATSDYLMYRYGIRPILSDIEMILKGLMKSLGKQRQTTRAYVKLDGTASEVFTSGYGIWLCTIDIQTIDSMSLNAMSLDEYYATLANNIGLSLKNLLIVPIELVSYSFVADWFLTLGDLLRSMAPSLEYKQLGSCLVTRRDVRTICTVTDTQSTSPAYSIVTPFSGFASAVRKQVSRTPLESPGVVLRADFRLSNLTRAADGVALLAQRFSGIRFK